MQTGPKPARRILLVDDDEQFRRMLRKTLIKMGYEILEARNGKEALDICSKVPVDLILTDIIMPEKEGLDTIGTVKSKHPAVKIVAMSGGGRGSATDYLKVATMLGADGVVQKPFSNESIEGVLIGLLEKG